MESSPLVVDVIRSGTVESTHLVDVAVVDTEGTLLHRAGEPARLAAFRSSVKPIQARASRELGWIPVSRAHLAIACASHNGEPAHVRAVRHLLAAARLDESRLRCPSEWPFLPSTIVAAGRMRAVQHNCSGKHAAFLAACDAAGLPLDTYLDPEHPLQRRARAAIEAATGAPAAATLVDGCGAPTLVFPLHAMARAFATIHGSDEATAMLEHPFLVGGTDRLDTALLAAGIVTKTGAEGLSCATFRLGDSVAGLALKVRDGATRARIPALVWVLEQLGVLPEDPDPATLTPPILGGGAPVGRPVVRGQLLPA